MKKLEIVMTSSEPLDTNLWLKPVDTKGKGTETDKSYNLLVYTSTGWKPITDPDIRELIETSATEIKSLKEKVSVLEDRADWAESMIPSIV